MTAEPLATFEGAVCQVRTMADGSPRYTIEAGEGITDISAVMMQAQEQRRLLVVVVYDAGEIKKATQKGGRGGGG